MMIVRILMMMMMMMMNNDDFKIFYLKLIQFIAVYMKHK